RPDFLPVKSRLISPSGDLTTRIRSFLFFMVRQPTHCRWGIFFCFSKTHQLPVPWWILFLRVFGGLLRRRVLDGLFEVLFLVVVGFGLDVDLIAGQAGGQTGVLALLADGQGQLV